MKKSLFSLIVATLLCAPLLNSAHAEDRRGGHGARASDNGRPQFDRGRSQHRAREDADSRRMQGGMATGTRYPDANRYDRGERSRGPSYSRQESPRPAPRQSALSVERRDHSHRGRDESDSRRMPGGMATGTLYPDGKRYDTRERDRGPRADRQESSPQASRQSSLYADRREYSHRSRPESSSGHRGRTESDSGAGVRRYADQLDRKQSSRSYRDDDDRSRNYNRSYNNNRYYGSRNNYWRGNMRHFHRHDYSRWKGGHWHHGHHHGRYGWWWVVGPSFYFYNGPVYPYPSPYVPPTVVVTETVVDERPAWWYYCENPEGYYPYVEQCYTDWIRVPAEPDDEYYSNDQYYEEPY